MNAFSKQEPIKTFASDWNVSDLSHFMISQTIII